MTTELDAVQAGLAALDFPPEVKQRAARAVARWLSEPIFAEYRPQLEALVERRAWSLVLDHFWQTIPFGTGGRRGPVGIGPNRFNTFTLLTSVQGHAEMLCEAAPGEEVSVVVAYDVRRFLDQRGVYDPARPNPLLGLSSADFAKAAAGVYAANGVRVRMLDPDGDAYMATPELSLAIRRHKAHGGLNVSASHNHPDDNGGKFYNRHGGQDVPPDDQLLADRVEGISDVRRLDFADACARGMVTFLGPDENEHYLAVNARLSLSPARGGRVVYTPLHGVGAATVGRLLRGQGFDVHPVPEQEAPDGRFPTVRFLAPNPEVPTCYEHAERVADEVDADMILATDPDADRIGLEIRGCAGGWEFVNGNEIILLVVRYLLERRRDEGTLPRNAFGLTTAVSSRRITTIARSYGVTMVDDLLVGFKYMADVLARLERDGGWRHVHAGSEAFVFGVEESHGLLLTSAVRDKDAAGPALLLAELNATLRARGKTLRDELDAIWRRFGYMANLLFTTVMTGAAGLARIRAIQASLRKTPPTEVAGRKVTAFVDFLDEERCWMGPLRSETDAAGRNIVVLELEGDARILIRPSGTEPKNKIYVEVPGVTPTRDLTAAELADERARCDAEARELGRAFERLSLARVGIELVPAASHVSNLLGIDQKVHFGAEFLPGLARRAREPGRDLCAWVSEALKVYGKDGLDLVRGGVLAWLADATLPSDAAERVRAIFEPSTAT
ncbi:MAG: phospho-sugar mutase [Planctomycetes bacterium]|nr:phospho-sugar mutase [Planctomycetota bacterium]